MSLDPVTNSMAVTGGEDDKAFVWRVSDGEVLLECTGEGKHKKTERKGWEKDFKHLHYCQKCSFLCLALTKLL